jgi:uncharacterized circularly permuted ATP-grasp superfamily protein
MTPAADAWHELLTSARAGESAGWLLARLAERGLMFGERPLCTVLRPRFLTPDQYQTIRRQIRVLLGAFRTALEAALARPDVLEQFRLEDWERTLVLEDPGIEASPFSRLDAFFSPEDGELYYTEYNAETPAGAGYNDALTELFLALPVMREFRTRWQVRPLPVRHHVLHSLVGAFAQHQGTSRVPVIGILDWHDVPTRSEFLLFQDYFQRLGYPCVIADPRETEYRDGRLWADGQAIDLIYKRVLISELYEEGGLEQPMVRAVRDGAVTMANPFRCKVLHKKASLAVLSDERNAELFTADERALIDAHVPWTRVVEDRATMVAGRRVDLLPFLAEHRDQLVLKPNDDYGGAGIVLGWEVDPERWRRAVAEALERPTIAQRRVGLPVEAFPSLVDGKVEFADRIVDTAPFVFDGGYVDGCLTRISTATLVNVTAGGGSTIPTFVVEPRDP